MRQLNLSGGRREGTSIVANPPRRAKLKGSGESLRPLAETLTCFMAARNSRRAVGGFNKLRIESGRVSPQIPERNRARAAAEGFLRDSPSDLFPQRRPYSHPS